MPRYREQQNPRQKLRQPDQSQIQRALGDLVDLPSHCDRLHLYRRHDHETRNLKQREGGMSKGYASGSGVGGGGHELLMCHRKGGTRIRANRNWWSV